MEINGLPIGFFVIAGGIILVLASWMLMRFGKVIARAVLAVAGLVIGLVIALAVLAQGAASFQTAQSTERVAKVAQTNATSNMVLVALAGCFGGIALLAVIVALGVAGVFWYKIRLAERACLPTDKGRERARVVAPREQALPEPGQQPVVWYVDSGQDRVDLSKVDLSQWGW